MEGVRFGLDLCFLRNSEMGAAMRPGGWVLVFPQRCHLPGERMGRDTQAPRGTRPWQWQALTSRHKGLLPASTPSEAIATVGSTGDRRALSLGSGRRRATDPRPAMLGTLGLALLALLRAVGPSQASGFTGEGTWLGEGDAGGAGGSLGTGLTRGDSGLAESSAGFRFES